MTSQIIRNSAIAPTSLVSFNLLNGEERNTLYLLGGGQTLTLEVTNISNGNLTFNTTSSNITLSFRPGTLLNPSKIQIQGGDWKRVRTNTTKTALVDDLTFCPTKGFVLKPNEVRRLDLIGVEGDNRAGSRPSQVELKLNGISSAGHGDVTDYTRNTFNVLNGYPGAASLVDTAKGTADEAQDFLEQLQRTYDDKHKQIDGKLAGVGVKHKQIDGKIKEIDDKHKLIDGKIVQVGVKHKQIDGKIKEIDDKHKLIDGKIVQVDAKHKLIDGKIDEVGAKHKLIDGKIDEIDGKHRTIDTKQEKIHVSQQKIDYTQNQINGLIAVTNELFDDVKEEARLISENAKTTQAIASKIVNPPFRVDILNGSNTILNNGTEENLLTLRIVRISTPPQDPLISVKAGKAAKIHFDFSELGEEGQISGPTDGRAAVKAGIWQPVSTSFIGRIVTIANPPVPYPQSSFIDVTLTFKCSGAAGSGRLKISYENLNDSDGDIYLLLYKSSLVIGANKVGLGTLPDVERLKVQGNVAIEGNLSVVGSTTVSMAANGGGKLKITNYANDNSIWLEASNKDGSGTATELLITGKERSNLPTLSLRATNTMLAGNLSVPGTSTLTGNVGIGAASGAEKLKVNGNVAIADSLSVTGNTAITGFLSVTGNSTLKGNTTIHGALEVHESLELRGVIRRNGQSLSYSGWAKHNAKIPVPWGTTDDWNVIVAPRDVLAGEWVGDVIENVAIIRMTCQLQVHAWNNKNERVVYAMRVTRPGNGRNEEKGFDVNYLLIAK